MVKSLIKNKLRTLSIDRYPYLGPGSPFLTGDQLEITVTIYLTRRAI